MDKGSIKVGLQLLIALIVIFALHYAFVALTDSSESLTNMGFTLEKFYAFEILFSLIVFFALYGIKNSLPENLGFVFLGLITLRLIASYLYVQEALDNEQVEQAFKFNFLAIVLIFLAGDAFVAYNILNKKNT